MLSPGVIYFLFFGFFGWITVALFLGFRGLSDGSLRVADTGAEVKFRKRVSERTGSTMMSALFIVGPLLQYGQGAINAAQHHQPVPVWAYFALFFGVLIAAGFGGLMLYLSGPRDLSLNLDRHTYQFISGWPQCPRVQAGPWEDMAGVYVRHFSGRSGVRYIVEIAWRCERRSCPILGRFGREEDAKALADQMAALLGLPRVAPPLVGKTSVDPAYQMVLTRAEEEERAAAFSSVPPHAVLSARRDKIRGGGRTATGTIPAVAVAGGRRGWEEGSVHGVFVGAAAVDVNDVGEAAEAVHHVGDVLGVGVGGTCAWDGSRQNFMPRLAEAVTLAGAALPGPTACCMVPLRERLKRSPRLRVRPTV